MASAISNRFEFMHVASAIHPRLANDPSSPGTELRPSDTIPRSVTISTSPSRNPYPTGI